MAMSKVLVRCYVIDSVKELKQLLKDVGDCEHAVGVCCCGLKRLIEDGETLLKELEPQPDYCEECGKRIKKKSSIHKFCKPSCQAINAQHRREANMQ